MNYVDIDHQNNPKPNELYLANVGKQILCCLNGVESASISLKLLGLTTIEVTVRKYLYDMDTCSYIQTEGYDNIDHKMELYVPGFGWYVITSIPEKSASSEYEETLSFTAESYEVYLRNINHTQLAINCGTEESREMIEENLSPDQQPIRNIILCDKEHPRYSFLHIALERLPMWSIGHVDSTIQSHQCTIEEDMIDVYSLLMNDGMKGYRCIFEFDTLNCVINAYDINTYGRDLGIYLDFQNLVSKLHIKARTEELYTRFEVSGGDNLEIVGINFGHNYVMNLDYYLPRLSDAIQRKYANYQKAIGTVTRTQTDNEVAYTTTGLRKQYIEKFKEQSVLLQQESDLKEREPISESTKDWAAFKTKEELELELNNYKIREQYLRDFYTNEHGVFEIDGFADYVVYYSIKDIIIPDITKQLAQFGTPLEEKDKVNAKTLYYLHGKDRLEQTKESYLSYIAALEHNGYDKASSEESGLPDADDFQNGHDMWVYYKNELSKENGLEQELAKRTTALDSVTAKLEIFTNELRDIEQQAELSNPIYEFSEDELNQIMLLMVDSSYQDDNYFVSEKLDDELSTINIQLGLLCSAMEELEIESRPQLDFDIDLNNPLLLEEFIELRNYFVNIGDFLYLDIGTTQPLKSRILEISFDLLHESEDFKLSFSSATRTKETYSDISNLLDSKISSSKSGVKHSASNIAGNTASAVTAAIMKPYLEIINAKFQNVMIESASIDNLKSLNATVTSLIAKCIKADEIETEVLNAITANIKEIFAEMIQSGKLVLSDDMTIESTNGKMVIDGKGLKVYGTNPNTAVEYLAVELGYDGVAPSFALRNPLNELIMTPEGLLRNGIPQDFVDQIDRNNEAESIRKSIELYYNQLQSEYSYILDNSFLDEFFKIRYIDFKTGNLCYKKEDSIFEVDSNGYLLVPLDDREDSNIWNDIITSFQDAREKYIDMTKEDGTINLLILAFDKTSTATDLEKIIARTNLINDFNSFKECMQDWKLAFERAKYHIINQSISDNIDQVQDSIDKAQTTADGKNKVFYQGVQPASPTGFKINDIWFDTQNDSAMHFWNGVQWVKQTFGAASISDNAITAEKILANSITTAHLTASCITAAKMNVLGLVVKNTSNGSPTFQITDTGEVKINASSLQIEGSDTITATQANDSIKESLNSYDETLNQEKVFNKLTNNGTDQGIYIENNHLYLNASYIKSGNISADIIKGGTLTLGGSLTTRNSDVSNGEFKLFDGSDNLIVEMNRDIGIVAKHGIIGGMKLQAGGMCSNDGLVGISGDSIYSDVAFWSGTRDCSFKVFHNGLVQADSMQIGTSFFINKNGGISAETIGPFQNDIGNFIGGFISCIEYTNSKKRAQKHLYIAPSGIGFTSFTDTPSPDTQNGETFLDAFKLEIKNIYAEKVSSTSFQSPENEIRFRNGYERYGYINILFDGPVGGDKGYSMCPSQNNGFFLGLPEYRWSTIYTTSSVNVSSLYELKTDIQPVESAINDILSTEVCSYFLISELEDERIKNPIRKYGFVIGGGYQITDKIVANTKDGIDEYNAIALSYRAIQELHAEIESLKQQIESLKNSTMIQIQNT